jgi:hypothetical protein
LAGITFARAFVRFRTERQGVTMERLISLFRRPNDFDFVDDDRRRDLFAQLHVNDEPEYFVQLMDYLRQRNSAGSAAREAGWAEPKLLRAAAD